MWRWIVSLGLLLCLPLPVVAKHVTKGFDIAVGREKGGMSEIEQKDFGDVVFADRVKGVRKSVFHLTGPAALKWSQYGVMQLGSALLVQPKLKVTVRGKEITVYRFTEGVILEQNLVAYAKKWDTAIVWGKTREQLGMATSDDRKLIPLVYRRR